MATVSPPEPVDGYPVAACLESTCGADIIWTATFRRPR